jgi:hypothetical protein
MIYLFLNLHLKTIVFLLKLKLQLPHAKLTFDGFWLLCLRSIDHLNHVSTKAPAMDGWFRSGLIDQQQQ